MPPFRKSKPKVTVCSRFNGTRFVKRKTYNLKKSHFLADNLGTKIQTQLIDNQPETSSTLDLMPEVPHVQEQSDVQCSAKYMKYKVIHEDLWKDMEDELLVASYSLEEQPISCCVCGEPAIYRCTDCGPYFNLCCTCLGDQHNARPFHSLEKWENGMWIRYCHPSLRVLSRDGHECDTAFIRKLTVFNHEGRAINCYAEFCNCEPMAVTVTRWRLWPAQARNVTVCCCIELLEWMRFLLFECHVSQQGFIDAVTLKNALTHEEAFISKQNYKLKHSNDEPKTKVPSVRRKKKSAFDVFKGTFLSDSNNGSSMAERMKNASVAWETVKADSSQRQVYQDMADQQNAEGRPCLETLDQQQKDVFIRKVCKEFRKLIEMLSSVGQNVAIMIADQDSLQCRTLGTIKGEDWMDARMELEGQLAAYCAGNPDPKTKDKSKEMRKKVKELFNRKYSAGAGLGTIRSVPYSQVDLYPERFRITGLPDGVTLKRPASYGRDKLERILEAADALTFQVVEGPRCQQSGQPGQKSARSGQPPASAEASPEAEPESGQQHTKPETESQSAPQYTESGQHSAQPGVKPTTPLASGSPEAPMDQATASDILSALANGGHTLEEYVDQEYREVKKEERKAQKRRAKTDRKIREKQLCIEIEKL